MQFFLFVFDLIVLVFQEVERLSKELSESKTKYEELSKQVNEMKVTNNSLKELVTTSQEALSKEQNIVKCFQDQISSNKVRICLQIRAYFILYFFLIATCFFLFFTFSFCSRVILASVAQELLMLV